MKKQVVLGMIATLALSTSVALASPVEMNEGQWQINMGAMINPDADCLPGASVEFDGDTSFYGGITYGLTDKWGLQYDYSHYDSSVGYLKSKVDAGEFNVLYKLNDNVNVFAGYVYVGGTLEDIDSTEGGHTDGFQAGLTGWYPLGDKFKTFGKIGLGNNSHVYEIGFSYEIVDNWDLDLSYRDVEYKDIAGFIDAPYDGVRVGVSTSF